VDECKPLPESRDAGAPPRPPPHAPPCTRASPEYFAQLNVEQFVPEPTDGIPRNTSKMPKLRWEKYDKVREAT
jgi:hypothetical protein